MVVDFSMNCKTKTYTRKKIKKYCVSTKKRVKESAKEPRVNYGGALGTPKTRSRGLLILITLAPLLPLMGLGVGRLDS